MYTTDLKRKDREWWGKAVKGDKQSMIISDLKTSTKYYFKIQARNDRGYGPFSPVTSFSTGQSELFHLIAHIFRYFYFFLFIVLVDFAKFAIEASTSTGILSFFFHLIFVSS